MSNNSAIKISYFKAPVTNTKPYKNISLSHVYMVLTGHWYRARTETVRQIEDKDQNRAYKANNFPFVTFSGTFKNRSEKGLIEHSGLITLDFDHVSNIEKLKMQLLTDPFFETELLFTSPNGNGLKWVVKIHISEQFNHGHWFDAIGNYTLKNYKIEPDKSGRDIARICFLCFDPDAFLHPRHGKMDRLFPAEIYLAERKKFNPGKWLGMSAEKRQIKPVPISQTETRIQREVETVLRRIEAFQIDITCEYKDWLKMGFSIASEFDESGRDYFHRVSRFYHGYDPAKTDNQFDECLKREKRPGMIKAFFAAAHHAGINVKV